ncbi:uncharacterized membrane protein (DUF106 family) [Lysobacter niastensis]|uniref:Uncharacterized membrane protein (DUF106 family) n=1 Tax=Lysobacter niastensis TaxID=380629 RepID=A0ABU1W8N6_9GAMM|nr:hypothetical protein [Lysobacter niastensis]MDR7133809.1 uncharacterized membrane protein (DUF106 family) [Lysobacter niastensis]
MSTDPAALSLLREIRDQQRRQLERQEEALSLQREQFALYKQQYDRAQRINEHSEALQARRAGLMTAARRMLWIVLPLIALLLAILFWSVLS